MRWLVRGLLGLLALVAALLLALALLLPRWVESAGFREFFDSIARERFGRSVDYGEVHVGVLPPRVDVAAVRVGGAREGDPPAVSAERVSLVLAWRPLLRAQAVVDALTVDGARLRIVRGADGLDLVGGLPLAAGAETAPRSGAPVDLRRFSLRDSELVFEDRTGAAPAVWRLEDLDLDLRRDAADGAMRFDGDGRLADGGDLRVRGTLAAGGDADAKVELRSVELGPLLRQADAFESGEGRADVDATVRRAADGRLSIEAMSRAQVRELVGSGLAIEGPFEARLTLGGLPDALHGPFTLDVTRTGLVVGDGAFRKPKGTEGRLEGTLRIDAGRVRADYELRLRNLQGRGTLRTQPRLRLELSAPAFALDGWHEMVPLLEARSLGGRLALENVVFEASPPALRGSAKLDAVRIVPAEDGGRALELDGFVEGGGNRLVLRDMALVTGGDARLTLAGAVEDLFGRRSLRLRLSTPAPVESNTLLSFFERLRDAIFGPLTLDADLGLPLAGDAPLVRAVTGTLRFQIGDGQHRGRIAGVSLLRAVFERFGALGQAALIAIPARRGRSLEDFYSEEFELAGASFEVRDGAARTDDLRIRYREYEVRLRGLLGLEDLSLDMTGEVRISPRIDALLAGSDAPGRERVIPLARLAGTLTRPRVTLRKEDVERFARQYLLADRREKLERKLERKLDEKIGSGAAGILRQVLRGPDAAPAPGTPEASGGGEAGGEAGGAPGAGAATPAGPAAEVGGHPSPAPEPTP